MTPQELVETIETLGGRIWPTGDKLKVDVPKGALSPELVRELKDRKADLLEYLRLVESCLRVEGMHVAMRIEAKDGGKGWWLVSTAQERQLVDDDAPVYEAREWLRIATSRLTDQEIRDLDSGVAGGLKRTFHGTVERIEFEEAE